MDAIYLPQLALAPEQTETIEVKEFLPELETLTPVQGQVKVSHQGNYLEVSARAETIITLTCDRCLQQYNHRLITQTSELMWLDTSADEEFLTLAEIETPLEALVETLSPQGYFHPGDWLYQQLCLEIPLRKLCDQTCTGISATDASASPKVDRRWSALEALRQNLLQS